MGIEYEGDERHSARLIDDMDARSGCRVGTPVTKTDGDALGDPILDPDQVTRYRGLAARANFMPLDRFDVQFGAKEASRRMANPMRSDMDRISRIARYLGSGHE